MATGARPPPPPPASSARAPLLRRLTDPFRKYYFRLGVKIFASLCAAFVLSRAVQTPESSTAREGTYHAKKESSPEGAANLAESRPRRPTRPKWHPLDSAAAPISTSLIPNSRRLYNRRCTHAREQVQLPRAPRSLHTRPIKVSAGAWFGARRAHH